MNQRRLENAGIFSWLSTPDTLHSFAHRSLPPSFFFLTDLPEIQNQKFDITEDKFSFEGTSRNTPYKVEFEFYAAVGEAKIAVHGKQANLIIAKKESGPFWPRLLKQAGKFNWLKTDFNKWVDEDEADNEAPEDDGGMPGMPPGFDFNALNAGMGGMGGMPGMGGLGGMMGGDEDDDSDEEDPLAADSAPSAQDLD